MKKVFNIVSKVMLIIAAVLFVLSIVVPGITGETADTVLTVLMTYASIVVYAVVGVLLMSVKNEIAQKIGHGMAITAFAIGFSLGLILINSTPEDGEIPMSALLLVIAAGFLMLHYIFLLVVKILNRGAKEIDNPSEDLRIVRLREWKKVLEEGMISEEEFEAKRVKILGLDKK